MKQPKNKTTPAQAGAQRHSRQRPEEPYCEDGKKIIPTAQSDNLSGPRLAPGWSTFLFIVFLFLSVSALAVRPDEMLANPKLEARAREIGQSLRCLVCQNQSIDDSDADLAHDLRVIVRQRLLAGDTDDQVKQYIVSRYGDYVLLKPPFEPETYLLWLGPLILFLGAVSGVVFYYRRSGKS